MSSSPEPPPQPDPVQGDMARRIAAYDWRATPLGAREQWPCSLRTLVDLMLSCPDPAYLSWGPAQTSLYNDAYVAILGDKHPHALGLPFAELFAEVHEEFLPLLQATLQGQPHHFEDRPVRLAGHPGVPLRWFTFSWTPARDDEGRVAGFYGTATETTAKVQAQQALRQAQAEALQASERRYKLLFEAIDEGFCVIRMHFDGQGRPCDYEYVEANPAFERLTGLHGALGRRVRELVPQIEQHWLDAYGQVALSGQPSRFTHPMAAVRRWFDVYAFRCGPPQEHLVAILFSDVTQRVKADERLKAVYGIQTVGVMFWGRGFSLTDMNDAFLRMTGYTRAEALGLTWQDFTPREFYPLSWKAVHEVSTRGETAPYEKQYFRKDGSRWWGLFAARSIGDEVVEFVLDVTERRHAEAALRDADQRKDVFLATLAHELRNPMAPLRSGLQIAQLTRHGDPRLARTVEMMDRQLTHLVRLVDDLLDVGRISSGKLNIVREPVLLSEALASGIERTQALIEQRGHVLQLHSPSEPLTVLGDFHRLSQVFSNLLTNAAKYTEGAGRIDVTLQRDGPGHAQVCVADTGIGIPPDEVDRVFDLFSQVRSHQMRAEGGLGIGLSLVQRLVALHGGEVSVDSAGLGHGSRFCVRLPLMHNAAGLPAAPQPHAPATPATAATPAPTAAPQAMRRIVLADDNRDAAHALAELLRLQGHQVWTADDGEQAVQAVQQHAPDTVILDLGMPNVDGYEAARRIRQLPAGRRALLLALSGWGQEADRLRSAAAGFEQHLVKPVDLARLQGLLG